MRILRERNFFQKSFEFIRKNPKDSFSFSMVIVLLIGFIATMIQLQKQQEIRQHASVTNCPVAYYSLDSEESHFLVLINQYRQSKGVGSLTVSSNLNRAAQFKVEDMVKQGTANLAHSDTTGRVYSQMIWDCGYPPYGVGENLYYTNSNNATADRAMREWQKSASHNENMLYAEHKQIGIARLGANAGWFWATEFGDGIDGTDGSFIGPPAAPKVISFEPSCNGANNVMTINFTPGSGATYHQLIYSPNCYTCAQQIVDVSSGQTIPTSGGFSANTDIFYNVQACNSIGCVIDPNGHYIKNTGASCSSGGSSATPTNSATATSTPPISTPTPIASSCPNTNLDGTQNQCRTSCLAGSSNLASGNAACTSFLAQTAYCCTVSSTSLCPNVNANGTTNTCRSGSCLTGETNLSSGNAVCAKALNSSTGNVYCCTAGSVSVSTPTPTPTSAPVSSCPNYDATTGYANICTTSPCPGGSSLYKSGSGNAACSAAYGSTYGNCCMVTGINSCPNDGYNTCRQTNCLSGETNVSAGNAVCAYSYGWHTGYCCRKPLAAPTPTPAIASSCPNYDASTGYANICTTSPCPGGSSLYKSGTGNAACSAAYGSYYGACCMVTNPSGCPSDGFNVCRQTSCLSGETNVSAGNAVCAYSYGWHTGYCCR